MDPQINTETGESVAQGRSPRFSMWAALTVFSVVVMGASVEMKNNQIKAEDETNSDTLFAVSCSTISVILSATMCAVNLFPIAATIVVGTFIEGALSLVLVIFWAACVSVVTNADDDAGEDFLVGVSNANLYYFSWAAFVTAVILIVNFLQEAFGLGSVATELRNRGGVRLNLWAALIAAQLVVAGASGRVLNEFCVTIAEFESSGFSYENDENAGIYDLAHKYCKRTKLGIAVGSIGVFLAVGVVIMKIFFRMAPFQIEFGMAVVMTVMNAFGVAFVTSDDGPGRFIGNLYYFSWISFLLSGFVAAECFGQMRSAAPADETSADGQNGHKEDTNDFPVEDLEMSPVP